FSGKLLVFISTVILARLLSKDDFGVVAYAVTAIAFLDVVSDLGVGPAVIYYPEDEDLFSTAFWLSLAIGAGLFVLTWLAAPLISQYFRDPRATEVTRVLALTYPIAALGSIQDVVLRKRLAFGKSAIASFTQAFTKGAASVLLALLGLGAWSLIWGQIGGAIAATLTAWLVSPWRPRLIFKPITSRALLGYGLHIVGVDLLAILLLNLDYLLVGRYLGAAVLGVYTLAFRLPDLLILQFTRILSTVLFPIYTRLRAIPGGLARGFFSTTRYVSLLTMPLGIGLALLARPFTLVVFTEKWADGIPVIRAISIYAMLLSLAYNAGSAYKADGRPQVLTWLGLARLAMLLPALWWAVSVPRSIVAVAWMQALVALLSGALNLYAAARLLDLPLSDLALALRPAALSSALMAAAVAAVLYAAAQAAPWMQLLLGVSVGGAAYLAALWLLQREIISEAGAQLRAVVGRG
ncbi:MAG: lipopolysaccharide biosynthesis protein, partial [Chloroflexota bacterium]